jgi:high frequency lysogenization protein
MPHLKLVQGGNVDDLRTREHALALAGLFQAVNLVQQVARQGRADTEPFESSIASVFRIDAESTEEIYGGSAHLTLGLRTLCRQLGKDKSEQDAELMRYAVSLLFLERQLVRNTRMMNRVREGIEAAIDQSEHFLVTRGNVLARLADTYASTVSQLQPRIMVQGEPDYLNTPANANRIRALLLAGMRSAVLWRQLGGHRLKLLWTRKRIVACAEGMLNGGGESESRESL